MPIDHEEISEKVDRLKLQQSITLQENLISEAKNKKSPDTRLIESLVNGKIDMVQKLNLVETSIKKRQENRVR